MPSTPGRSANVLSRRKCGTTDSMNSFTPRAFASTAAFKAGKQER